MPPRMQSVGSRDSVGPGEARSGAANVLLSTAGSSEAAAAMALGLSQGRRSAKGWGGMFRRFHCCSCRTWPRQWAGRRHHPSCSRLGTAATGGVAGGGIARPSCDTNTSSIVVLRPSKQWLAEIQHAKQRLQGLVNCKSKWVCCQRRLAGPPRRRQTCVAPAGGPSCRRGWQGPHFPAPQRRPPSCCTQHRRIIFRGGEASQP